MNSRITNVEIKPTTTNTKPKHTWFMVEFTVDGKEERDWAVYDKLDELAVFEAFQRFITFTFPERETS